MFLCSAAPRFYLSNSYELSSPPQHPKYLGSVCPMHCLDFIDPISYYQLSIYYGCMALCMHKAAVSCGYSVKVRLHASRRAPALLQARPMFSQFSSADIMQCL